jgi:hypothetical protein
MTGRSVNIELPEEIWKIIDTQFKLNGESDSEIISNIVENHLAHRYYQDIEKSH